jgi:hypothetical protein
VLTRAERERLAQFVGYGEGDGDRVVGEVVDGGDRQVVELRPAPHRPGDGDTHRATRFAALIAA